MLNQLQMAKRKFETIRPEAGAKKDVFQAEKLAEWLENDVCAITEELVRGKNFRSQARWPIDKLTGENVCEERALVEATDRSLIECASAHLQFASEPEHLQRLLRLGPYAKLLQEDDPRGQDPVATIEHGHPVPLGMSAIEFIAGRPWRDLVAEYDYFHMVTELNLKEDSAKAAGERVPLGIFTPYFNPRLQPLGDFVSRAMLIRVEHWMDLLHKFRVRCHNTLNLNHVRGGPLWEVAGKATSTLQQNYESLKALCCDGRQARLRQSCIVLVQIYAGYKPKADLTWLGLPTEYVSAAQAIPYLVRNRRDDGIAEQAALAMIEISDMFQKRADPETILVEAKERHSLVLVSGLGVLQLYWKGQLSDTKWDTYPALWEFLWALADKAKIGQGVDALSWGIEEATASLKDRKYRLKKLLPEELHERIVASGVGTYKLALVPKEICLLIYDEKKVLHAHHTPA